jgi:hypothetical protein
MRLPPPMKMKLPILVAATLCALLPNSQASIGFHKTDCAVYGNLIEKSPSRHVYENKYVHYIFNYNSKDTVTSFEVTFDKGQHPNFLLMTSVMPNPISNHKRLWTRRSCSNDVKCISLVSKDQKLKAHFAKERWNKRATVLVTSNR